MNPKTPVIIKSDYVVYFERYQGNTFIHCDVFKWNKTSRSGLLRDLGVLWTLHNEPVFAFHDIGDSKHKKFLKTCGFKFLRVIQGTDLILREIWVIND